MVNQFSLPCCVLARASPFPWVFCQPRDTPLLHNPFKNPLWFFKQGLSLHSWGGQLAYASPSREPALTGLLLCFWKLPLGQGTAAPHSPLSGVQVLQCTLISNPSFVSYSKILPAAPSGLYCSPRKTPLHGCTVSQG